MPSLAVSSQSSRHLPTTYYSFPRWPFGVPAFRPVVSRKIVTAGYGVSIAYVAFDIGNEGWKASLDRKDRLAASSVKAATLGEKGSGGAAEPNAATEIGLRVARRTGQSTIE